jgi:hypothetical protein
MNPEHQHRELRQCERDLAYIRARLALNPGDVFAARWQETELAHRDRLWRVLEQSGAGHDWGARP